MATVLLAASEVIQVGIAPDEGGLISWGGDCWVVAQDWRMREIEARLRRLLCVQSSISAAHRRRIAEQPICLAISAYDYSAARCV
jgi:hypothetical protein